MAHGRRVLIVGLGDLGTRIALRLAAQPGIDRVVLSGRDAGRGAVSAHFIGSCGTAAVSFERVDALESSAVAELVRRTAPDVVVQCASMHSPWALSDRSDPVAEIFSTSGFASQIAAQLPPVLAVMQGVRQAKFAGAVINCSYPDVTNPMLQRLDLAPTAGIGNAGMIHSIVQARLHERGIRSRLRTVAHHSHVSRVAAANLAGAPESESPRIFLDDAEVSIAGILADAPSIPLTRELNELTAAHAVRVITALVGVSPEFRTALPGVAGLPGGWPALVREGDVAIDLPAGISFDEALDFNNAAARSDGVEHIGDDGTVHFTEQLQAALSQRWPGLASPLHPHAAFERYGRLRAALSELA